MGQYARPIQRFKAARLYKTDPQAREALDRLNARAEADPNVTQEAYLAAQERARELTARPVTPAGHHITERTSHGNP